MKVGIKTQIIFLIWLVVTFVAAFSAYAQYYRQVDEYMSGIDRNLNTAALMARSILGEDYHDNLRDKDSVSEDKFRIIVERFNQLCLKLDLQYLWSNLILDDQIVFTSSTSTSKDASNGDHANFFDAHSNPEAFESVLTSNQSTYSTFTNEWGKGRMILLPYKDKLGRTYVVGASISVRSLEDNLFRAGLTSASLFLFSIVGSAILGLLFANRLIGDIKRLSVVTDKIAKGDYGVTISSATNCTEIESLVQSINSMSSSIQEHDENLNELAKERALELYEADNKVRIILENCGEVIITADRQGRIDSINPAGEELFGCKASEVQGKKLPLRVKGSDEFDLEDLMSIKNYDATKGLIGALPVTGLCGAGKEVPLKLKIRKISLGGNHWIYVLILEDIARQLEYENNLKNAKASADAANRAKTVFLASMSHELRTPLNAILGFTQLLFLKSKGELSEEFRQLLSYIDQGGKHLLHLISNILDLTKIEAGEEEINLREIHTLKLIEECCTTVLGDAEKRGVTILVESENYKKRAAAGKFSVDYNVIADTTRFKQVLINLLSNAIKYNKEKGSVVITFSKFAKVLKIDVADTGVGIPLSKQDNVFVPFNRLGLEASDIEGSGVGLALTKKLVELMSGEIGFSSKEEVGSHFWIKLPLATIEPEILMQDKGADSTFSI